MDDSLKTSVTGFRKPVSSYVASKSLERARVAKARHQERVTDLLIKPEQAYEDFVARRASTQAFGRRPASCRVGSGGAADTSERRVTCEQIAERLELSPAVVLGELSRAYSQWCSTKLDREDVK